MAVWAWRLPWCSPTRSREGCATWPIPKLVTNGILLHLRGFHGCAACRRRPPAAVTMTIFYCLVANRHCPLAESSHGGDKKMSDFAHKLLKRLNFADAAVESVDYEAKTYSYRVEDEVAYVCVTNEAFGKKCVVEREMQRECGGD